MSKDLILLDTNIVIYTLQTNPIVSDFVNGKRGVISFSARIKKATIDLKSKYGSKLADAFIAACAIEFDIPLVSADSGFDKIKELNFIHILPTTA
jgi:predicted nucleic acid-binding protein